MTDNFPYDLHSAFFENKNYKSCFARSIAEVSKELPVVHKKEEVRLRKTTRNNSEEPQRYPQNNSNIYSSIRKCSSRITEVENMMHQTKLETLQWQLKETQKNRDMYRAVMKQVVTYLEKVHHSLELLGSRISRRNSIHRSKFEQRKEPEDVDEIPPEKLAQEAFRLLRTAESLLNTQEPDLVPDKDAEFMEQLAREFPPQEIKRATSFSLSPKLIVPEISTTFDRKLSLQLDDVRRCVKNDSGIDNNGKIESISPANGSISSVEDESGFSSMNSFQEVGLPVLSSTASDEVSTKNALLRSMLRTSSPTFSTNPQESVITETVVNSDKQQPATSNDIKLWRKPAQHKRWNSSPAKETENNRNFKVLWV
ncbi:uncharacterized protein LOC130899138 [Diorhabda carinulata]|uniref:uncharacterized protein LOC130899138 n=1 Tax=Diorhabda carinulata TaxID=1163345 RepID=UPI0025A0AA5C|nr:uncharacterized protein LOC130899138 [Diorhabda carinulata]